MLKGPYQRFHEDLKDAVPHARIATDPLKTLAYGTDASFYRLIPKVVVKAETEDEIIQILKATQKQKIPVTFRAAGTSLSGQAITDSVLVIAGETWQQWEVLDQGRRIRLQPGIIGAKANEILSPFGRKIGPDPASINAAMIGGIAANNASGMCCGTAQNSYQTVDSIRVILADGTLVDTGDEGSKDQFRQTHGWMLERLDALGKKVRADAPLAKRIKDKFAIKNTNGYSLNALVDYKDPFDIITHLMIGSEGTLGFIARVTYKTVEAPPFKATSLMIFPEIDGACKTAAKMQSLPVAAAELMDRPALRSVEGKPGMPEMINRMPGTTTALLVETQASDFKDLETNVQAIADALKMRMKKSPLDNGRNHEWLLDGSNGRIPSIFTDHPEKAAQLWNIRKGLLPSAGAVRRTGTTALIEDVAFPIHHLAPATLELQEMFETHGYHEAIIFGHALAGNLHFVFSPDFGRRREVNVYGRFMEEMSHMVVDTYDGSLKAEHGTGRNMAPFVEMEWGKEAYRLMEEIKSIFDPDGRLNPGVILNPNPKVHLENLKPLHPADPLIDKCIECGFCECRCPSRNLTLTPRQRIVVQREIARLTASGENPFNLMELKKGYAYQGEATCAADGLCGMACPVDINTGSFTKSLRAKNVTSGVHQWTADMMSNHFEAVLTGFRWGLKAMTGLQKILGPRRMGQWTGALRRLSGGALPAWNPCLPTADPSPKANFTRPDSRPAVVYFPACVARTMGPALDDPCDTPLYEVTDQVLKRAGYRVIYPKKLSSLCCGLPFESKGFFEQADKKSKQLEDALMAASENGRLPVLCDTSPCLERMRRSFGSGLSLFEPVAFTASYLLDRLEFNKIPEKIAVHITCSSRKMGLDNAFLTVAGACAETVVIPNDIECCGFAGDRGFSHPELNASALSPLKQAVKGCREGFSNSRTCEIGLSLHSGIHYRSMMYLVEQCTRESN